MREMKDNYEEMFKVGEKAQKERMDANNTKHGWDNVDIKYAYKRIKKETRKLWKEIYLKPFIFLISGMQVRNYTWHRGLSKKAANIANFSHMIILKCDKETNNE